MRIVEGNEDMLNIDHLQPKFVPNYAQKSPLTNLLKKDMMFKIEAEQEKYSTFEMSKPVLITDPVLKTLKIGEQTEVHTDASKVGIGAVLL